MSSIAERTVNKTGRSWTMRWIRLAPQAKAPGIGAFIHGRSQGARKTAGTTIIFISDVLGSLSCDNCFDMMSPTSVAYRSSSFLRSRALGTCRCNDAMRFKGHLLRRYHSLTCEPCTREIRDSRVCKTSAIKYDPDALDNLVEPFTFKGSRP